MPLIGMGTVLSVGASNPNRSVLGEKMMMRLLLRPLAVGFLVAVGLFLDICPCTAAETDTDELLLKAANIPTDDRGLRTFFHERSKSAADPREASALVKR